MNELHPKSSINNSIPKGFYSGIFLEVIRAESHTTVFSLQKPLVYKSNLVPLLISVPVGFRTDLATIPKILHSLARPSGDLLEASIVHDWLYSSLCPINISRTESDKVFLEAMLDCSVPKWKAYLAYWIVRLCGSDHYRVNKPTLNP